MDNAGRNRTLASFVVPTWEWSLSTSTKHGSASNKIKRVSKPTLQRPQKVRCHYLQKSLRMQNSAESSTSQELDWDLDPASLKSSIVILWFRRNNLRLSDSQVAWLAGQARAVIAVFVFDPNSFGASLTAEGFQKTGPHQTWVIWKSVEAVREAMRSKGSELFTAIGSAADKISNIVQPFLRYEMDIRLISSKDFSEDGLIEERAVVEALDSRGIIPKSNCHFIWNTSLYSTKDLERLDPRKVTSFGEFIKLTSSWKIPGQYPSQDRFPSIPTPTPRLGTLPDNAMELKVEGMCTPLNWPFPDPRAVFTFTGGETNAVERMADYVWTEYTFLDYVGIRQFLGAEETSSKLSPWINVGNISVRDFAREIQEYEKIKGQCDSSKAMLKNLRFRDYLHYKGWVASQSPSEVESQDRWPVDLESYEEFMVDRWIEGLTGFPFIDACMRELKATGYLAFPSRQIVAHFFVHIMGIKNIQIGIDYFRSILIDYDSLVTEYFWKQIASSSGQRGEDDDGMAFDSAPYVEDLYEHSVFHDPDSWYTCSWCRELWRADFNDIFMGLWRLPRSKLESLKIKLGNGKFGEYYPYPMLDVRTRPYKFVDPMDAPLVFLPELPEEELPSNNRADEEAPERSDHN